MSAEAPAGYDPRTLEASEDLVNYYAWVLQELGEEISGRTLEIGAGTGTMSARLVPRADEVVLVEPAPNLVARLAERFGAVDGVTVVAGELDAAIRGAPDAFAPGFDTIASFNVLEHIADDVGTLLTAASLLRPGGRLVLFVPSGPFLYGTLDAQVDHVRRYTKATLRAAIEGAGLHVDRLQPFDLLGMVPWFVMGRVLRRTTTGGGARGYDRFVVPVCHAVDRILGPPIGKNLVAVAHRPDG